MTNWSVKWQRVLDVVYEAVNEFSSNVKTGGGIRRTSYQASAW